MIGQIALVPILLAFWGDRLYGEWQILAAAVAYVTVLDFGMQTYVVNCMNQGHARGKMPEFTRMLHSALAFSWAVSAAAAVVLIPLLLLAPLDRWFDLTLTSLPTARLIAVVLALQVICSLPTGVVGGVYRAIGEYAREITIANVLRLTTIALTALIAVCGGGLLAVAAMQLITLVMVLWFLRYDLQRRHPEIRVGIRKRDWRMAFSFLAPSSLFFLMQLSAALTIQGGTLLIGATLGAGSVAVFATLRTLVNLIPQATNSLSSTLWPEFTAMEARGEYEALDALHRLTAKSTLCLSICAAVFLHFTGRDIVALWTGDRIVYDQRLLDAFLLLQIAATWHLMSSLVLSSSNNHKALALSRLVSSSAGLAIGYLLIGPGGAAGAVLGLVIADVATCGWLIPRAACRLLRHSMSLFLREVLGRGVVFLGLLYTVSYAVLHALSAKSTGLQRLLAEASTVAAAGTALFYLLWLNRAERNRMRSLLPGMIPSRLLRQAAWKS